MNQKRIRISTIVVVLLLAVLFTSMPGLAQTTSDTEAAGTAPIQIYVDGTLLMPLEDSPRTNEPLLYEGTVYLPIGAISDALGKPVEWDSATNSVYIGEPAEIVEITVSTAEELISALGSNRRILLEEGVYNLTEGASGYVNSNVYFGARPDGSELILDGLHNLTIEGIGDKQSEIVVESRYANVINFSNCSNIRMVNLKAGHTQGGICSGGVFWLENCKGIEIDRTDMYGCGIIGLSLHKVENMKVTDSTIYECTSGIMSIHGGSNISFANCVFRDNKGGTMMVSVWHTSGLTFEGCSFLRNAEASAMFYLSSCENIEVRNNEFVDNHVQRFVEEGELSVDVCRFVNNLFDEAL